MPTLRTLVDPIREMFKNLSNNLTPCAILTIIYSFIGNHDVKITNTTSFRFFRR